MKLFGMIALAAAGVGFLCYTDKGREWMSQGREMLTDGYSQATGFLKQQSGDVQEIVQNAIHHDLPDTAMAHAFEEAVA